jgi:superfamily II DNA or RNA helicase
MKAQPILTGATALYAWDEKLAERFTVMSRFDEPVQLWSRVNGYIRLPRGVCPLGKEDKRVAGAETEWSCKAKARNPDQERVFAESKALLDKKKSFIIRCPTGFGKTVIGIVLAAHYRRKVLVVTTKSDLLNNWYAEFLKFTNLSKDRIGFVRQDSFDVVDKDVVIAMVHSLAIEDRYPAWLRNEFGLVIFDECDQLGAETFSRVASMFPSLLRVGLTATPNRADGKEVVFFSHIGPVMVEADLITLPPKVLRYKSPWVLPKGKFYHPDKKKIIEGPMPHAPGKLGKVLRSIADCHPRNIMLRDFALVAHRKGRKTVCFSDLKDHLEVWRDLVTTAGIPEEECAFYVSGMSEKALDKAKVAPLIFATYGMMGRGTNIPWLDCAIFGTPRADVEQITGRVLREYPGKSQPVVFDLVDSSSPVLKGYANVRLKYYQRVKGVVKLMGG